nr:MAG TPA: hypothetical protein [Caudoviricetes sp.]
MSNFILKTLETRELKLNTIRLRGFYGGKLWKGSGGGGSGDGFPQLPGDVTRWHFGGLTNEMMAAMDDPRLEDADGKGRFLSFKNFAWKEGSGISDIYPGALVFDGVDDRGTCDNFPILTKEKGYTVVALRQWDQDFLNTTLTGGLLSTRNYSTGEGVAFEKIESSNKGYWNLGAGGIIDFAKSPFTWQTSKQYNNVGILKGDKNHGKPLCVGCGLSGGQQCGRFAIWELVFLDHDATEEELNKIKDYFVKTYPWLFPDQAWTVVGKTNEDEDRATIANITGNGNDLVCLNLGFIEGSGYNEEGEYAGYLVTDGVDDKITSSTFEMGNDWTVIGDWGLINTGKKDNAGIVKFDSIVIYNYNPILINIKNGRNNLIPDQNTVNAICSDGRIYSKDWKESIYNEETESTSKNLLTIGYSGNNYTKIAFKNLAIYPTVLSKEDCIKAYNYLQTLKAK